MERNKCLESGCPGYCCENIDIIITKSEQTRLFKKAKEVASIGELAKIKEDEVLGAFYTKYASKELGNGDFFVIALNGPCPNRTTNGECSMHEERSYPARNFKIGSPDCNEIRKEHGLPPIFVEPVE